MLRSIQVDARHTLTLRLRTCNHSEFVLQRQNVWKTINVLIVLTSESLCSLFSLTFEFVPFRSLSIFSRWNDPSSNRCDYWSVI